MGLILLSGVFFLKPKITEILRFRKEISGQKKTLAQLTQKAAFLEGLDEVELEEKSEYLLKFLPAEKDVPRAMAAVKFLGSQAETGITKIGVDLNEQKGANLPFFTFSLTTVGTAEKIINLLEKIESSSPFMKVDKIEVSFKEGEEQVSADIQLKNFFLPLPKDLGSVESPLVPITKEEEKIYEESLNFTPVLSEEEWVPVPAGKENLFHL